MDVSMQKLIAMLDKVAADHDGGEVAQNVLIAVGDLDEATQEVIVSAVADGLGVPLG